MIFMTCSTVTPGFGVRIVSTPVILGCGGVDWPCTIGARTVANASSRYHISIFIVQLLLLPHGIWIFEWYHWVPRASLDDREDNRLRPRVKIVVLYGTSLARVRVLHTASDTKLLKK